MNEVITRDYRKKDNLKWFNDNFFIAVYDQYDNFITNFDNIESTTNALNISLKKILESIRNKTRLEYKGKKLRLFVYKKEKIDERTRRR